MQSKILPLYEEQGPIHQLPDVDVTSRITSRFFVIKTRHNCRPQCNRGCTSSDSSRCSFRNVSTKQRPIVNAAAGNNGKELTLLKGFG
ncbi:hypothetical protein FOFC_17903 [Fusarium oxysporum]|nr:hypothetical protein FOFC_17903 [Fusarium oxysporum]